MRLLGLVALALALGACGFDVRSGDDFLLTRAGAGHRLTVLVNDGGTIRCNGGATKPISSSLLIDARDLVVNLQGDATRRLALRSPADSVYRYTVQMQAGSISFPDTAAGTHHELAGVEEFALRALAGPCR